MATKCKNEIKKLEIMLKNKEKQLSRQKKEKMKLETDLSSAKNELFTLKQRQTLLKNSLLQSIKKAKQLEEGNNSLKINLQEHRQMSQHALTMRKKSNAEMLHDLENIKIKLENLAFESVSKDHRIKQINNEIETLMINLEKNAENFSLENTRNSKRSAFLPKIPNIDK